MKKPNYKDLSLAELQAKRSELKQKYMDLRFQFVVGHVVYAPRNCSAEHIYPAERTGRCKCRVGAGPWKKQRQKRNPGTASLLV